MNAIWVTRDKSNKIDVKDGLMKDYFLDQGKYVLIGSGKAEKINRIGEYVTSSGHSPLESYRTLKIADKLLTASVDVTDAPAIEIVFARVGHEDDFPPLPVYAKTREQIAIKEIDSLSFAIGDLDGRIFLAGGETKIPDSWKDLSEIYISVELGSGEKSLRYSFSEHYAEKDGAEKDPFKKEGYLSQEQAAFLFDIATDSAILSRNPSRDTDEMTAPFLTNDLQVRFKSGEIIRIESSHGFAYDIGAAGRIVEFFRSLLDVNNEETST